MSKIEKIVNEEINTLQKKYGKVVSPRLFSLFEYSDEQLEEKLQKNIQEIDRIFESCKITKITELYENKTLNGLVEYLIEDTFINMENDIEKIREIITKEKAKLSIKLKKQKKNMFLAYKNNEKQYQHIFMPALVDLVEKKYEVDSIISKIRMEFKELIEEYKMKKIKIYTYCTCIKNPGTCIWNVAIKKDGTYEKFNGTVQHTTSNAIELIAVIEALKRIDEHSQCVVFTSSYYIINTIKKQWLTKWKENGWKTSDRKLVKNKKLWLKLDELLKFHSVELKKI